MPGHKALLKLVAPVFLLQVYQDSFHRATGDFMCTRWAPCSKWSWRRQLDTARERKINPHSWNCSFWTLLRFCSLTHSTSKLVTSPWKYMRYNSNKVEWFFKHWNQIVSSLYKTLCTKIFLLRLDREKPRSMTERKWCWRSSLKPYATRQEEWHPLPRYPRTQPVFQLGQGMIPNASSFSGN